VCEAEHKTEEDAFRKFSDSEMDVMVELARGRTNAEIGKLLNLSEKTVRNYVSAILEKLHLNNQIELTTNAVAHHLFEKLGRE
jgi:DNA-binding NarL/FixJ family response regulator